MAQRIRYKVSKKIQGLASKYCRLKDEPTRQELNMVVHTGAGRETLQQNRMKQVMREAKNLKDDLMQDGFSQYLLGMPQPRNDHYLKAPVKPQVLQWFQRDVTPAFSHEERTGISNQYAGNAYKRGFKV